MSEVRVFVLSLAAAAAAGLLLAGPGWSQTSSSPAPGPAAAAGPHVVRLTNSGRGGIVAIYVSPSGSSDTSDDLLGKQTAGPGKTVTLKIVEPKATCLFDLQFLMSDGSTVYRKAVNLCQTSAYTFSP